MRVQEALTYLATALPRFTFPAARMLALQCALRADARLAAGLLRSMRLHGRTEIWEELAHAAWLHSPDLRSTPVEVQLLDAAILEQVPGRRARCRAAHWALRPPAPAPAPAQNVAARTAAGRTRPGRTLKRPHCAQRRHGPAHPPGRTFASPDRRATRPAGCRARAGSLAPQPVHRRGVVATVRAALKGAACSAASAAHHPVAHLSPEIPHKTLTQESVACTWVGVGGGAVQGVAIAAKLGTASQRRGRPAPGPGAHRPR